MREPKVDVVCDRQHLPGQSLRMPTTRHNMPNMQVDIFFYYAIFLLFLILKVSSTYFWAITPRRDLQDVGRGCRLRSFEYGKSNSYYLIS